jgi:hypothetical protein
MTFEDGGSDRLQLVRRVAALVKDPAPGNHLDSRALLATALRTDGWHHAIPVLVSLEPGALISLRDVVLNHLRSVGE